MLLLSFISLIICFFNRPDECSQFQDEKKVTQENLNRITVGTRVSYKPGWCLAHYNLRKAGWWFADERNATQRWLIEEQMPVPKKVV